MAPGIPGLSSGCRAALAAPGRSPFCRHPSNRVRGSHWPALRAVPPRRVRSHALSNERQRRPGAGRGGARGWAGNAPEEKPSRGASVRRAAMRRAAMRRASSDFVSVVQLPLPPFLPVSPPHLWPLLRSCAVSYFGLDQFLKTTCAFAHGTKPYNAFRYPTKCVWVSRGSTMGIFLWLLIYFCVCSFPLLRTLHLPVGQSSLTNEIVRTPRIFTRTYMRRI